MNRWITLYVLVGLLLSASAQQKNEVALVIAPLKFKEATSYQALYRRGLKNDMWSLRGGLRVFASTNKEIRSDTLSSQSGTVQYDFSVGVQRKLPIEGLESICLYVANDIYYNSELNQKSYETYYGYYWNFGTRPAIGISYEPFDNIRLSFESRADLNINLQEYNAPGENQDERISFSPLKQLALGLGYLF